MGIFFFLTLSLGISCSVSAETVEVFVLAGQSNAVGAFCDVTALPEPLTVPQADIFFAYEEGRTAPSERITSGPHPVPLGRQSDPSGVTVFGSATYPVYEGFGSELALGRSLADALPTGVAVVKFGINGTRIYPMWDPSDPGSLFAQTVALIRNSFAELELLGHQPRLRALFWMQGESDALRIDYATRYERELTRLISAFREEFADPELPVIIGRLSARLAESQHYSFPCLSHIRAAQETVAAADSHCLLVDTDDFAMGPLGVHFTSASQLELGRRFAAAYLRKSVPALSPLSLFMLTLVFSAALALRRHRKVAI